MYREVEEECGLDLKQHRFEIMDAVQVHSRCRIFLIRLLSYPVPHCTPPLEDGKENHEIVKVEWVPWLQVQLKTMNSVTKKAVMYTDSHLEKMRSKYLKATKRVWMRNKWRAPAANPVRHSGNSSARSWKRSNVHGKLMNESNEEPDDTSTESSNDVGIE
jgi:hypothetical protein